MRRDSSGSRLYLYGWSEVATVDESGKLMPVSKALPSKELCGAAGSSEDTCKGLWKRAYLNDAGSWAAWMSMTEAHFGDWSRPVSSGQMWVDPGVTHYLVRPKEGGLELGTVDGRLKQSIGEIDPLGLYSVEGAVYVFGVRAEVELVCLVYSENSLGFELHRTVRIAPFGWPSIAVVDMDLAGKRVVVEKNYDTSQPWFLFDFGTGVLTKIGQKSAYGFFLRSDLLRKQPLSRTRPAPGE